jgi:2-polyprenyl-3-methyl-5-hydroxy-6-metoxy-1,4-benzoquinol methylase
MPGSESLLTEPSSPLDARELECAVCGNSAGNRTVAAREMMFGTREAFVYVECANCGCLHLSHVPSDLSRFYGETYYSLRRDFRAWVRRHKAAYRLAHVLITHRLPDVPDWWPTDRRDRELEVLDVGCGAGNLLLRLQSLGFRRLLGIDPFIPEDIRYKGGLVIHRQSLASTTGRSDVIVMNHSFEHMGDPKEAFSHARRLLADNGVIIIRTPVAESWAWRHYGADWVQLDAPRHLFVHTEKSIKTLAAAAGLQLVSITYDSTALQFWGSEQYRRGVPFTDSRSYLNSHRGSMFSRSEIRSFEHRAVELNLRGEGDQACFYLQAAAGPQEVPS